MRYQFQESASQSKRKNEALWDLEMLVGDLALPAVVGEASARWIPRAHSARLPGGHMAWESLAGGGVWLAAGRYGHPHSADEMAQQAKTSTERLCAAARKPRVELDLPVAPGRQDTVAPVGEAVGDGVFEVPDRTVAQHLMLLADDVPVGPGTPLLTVTAAAVYAALKLCGDTSTARRYLTQAQVVEAVSPIVDLSTNKIGRYSCELVDVFEARHGTLDPAVVVERDAAAD